MTPGFVDMHVHVTGGGGEAGPASRCPESQLSDFLRVGTTTVVGVCGTDSVSRSQALAPAATWLFEICRVEMSGLPHTCRIRISLPVWVRQGRAPTRVCELGFRHWVL